MIYHLNRTQPYAPLVGRLLDEARAGTRVVFASVISELEVLVQPVRRGRQGELSQIRALFEEIRVVELDRAIARTAATIRAERRLALPDAAIVATALHTDCDVIVGNDERCAQRVQEIPYVLLDALVEEEQA